MHLSGIIIGALSILTLAGFAVFMLVQSAESRSKTRYFGVGVTFMPGANTAMLGVPQACQTIHDILMKEFPDVANQIINNLEIQFYPVGTRMPTEAAPMGQDKVTGTADETRVNFLAPDLLYAKVWQTLPTDSPTENRTAGQTALFHEVFQHILPLIKESNWNANHDPKWFPYETEADTYYSQLMAADASTTKTS